MKITIKGSATEIGELLKCLDKQNSTVNTTKENSEKSIADILKEGIAKHGVPKETYIDNGTDYTRKKDRRPMADLPDFY